MNQYELCSEVNDEDKDFIIKALVAYNTSQVPLTQEKGIHQVNLKLRDEQENIVAALLARIYGWNAMEVSILWVDEKHRKKGLGSQLMREAESIARKSNCTLIHLDTFDFQAPEYYKKLGYEVFGELNNSPAGHKRFYLKKDI